MFYWLFYELLFEEETFLSFLRVFKYITFRSAYSAIFSLVLSFFIIPIFIRLFKEKGVFEVTKSEYLEHKHKEQTPTMGGITILFALIISTLLWARLNSPSIILLFLSVISFGLLGFIDDWLKQKRRASRGLSIRCKLLAQITVGAFIGLWLYLSPLTQNNTVVTIPFTKGVSFDLGIFYIPFCILVIVAASNAVNLTDGLDGLAIGSVIFVTLGLIGMSYVAGHSKFSEYLKIDYVKSAGEVVVFLSALIGASLGFLWYNSHPAQIFLGDTGSLALGGILGVVALIIKQELALIIVGGLFVVEAGSVLIQILSYRFTKKRVFAMAPLHHHFEKKGWSESKIVIRFWIIAIIFVLLSLSTLKIR